MNSEMNKSNSQPPFNDVEMAVALLRNNREQQGVLETNLLHFLKPFFEKKGFSFDFMEIKEVENDFINITSEYPCRCCRGSGCQYRYYRFHIGDQKLVEV